jgi:hypothetical protein
MNYKFNVVFGRWEWKDKNIKESAAYFIRRKWKTIPEILLAQEINQIKRRFVCQR